MLRLDTLPQSKGKKKKRIGRGNASKGNYSGRGMKGQRSRSGGKGGLKLKGLKQSMLATPKVRGFKSGRPANKAVNCSDLEKAFESGDTVTAKELVEKGLMRSLYQPVKILGTGTLTKKLTVKVHAASKTAKEAITKAGGTFEPVSIQKRPKKEGSVKNIKTKEAK
ncbi:MAG: 50S ribosomal protein L15 [Candidatus Kerfeldbacteria bacterium]